jgi:hypothetical protein
MNQRSKLVASLGVVTVLASVVAVYAFYGVYEADKADVEKKTAEEKLLAFDKAAIERLTIFAKGQTTVVEKGESGWKLTAPVQAVADKASTGSTSRGSWSLRPARPRT